MRHGRLVHFCHARVRSSASEHAARKYATSRIAHTYAIEYTPIYAPHVPLLDPTHYDDCHARYECRNAIPAAGILLSLAYSLPIHMPFDQMNQQIVADVQGYIYNAYIKSIYTTRREARVACVCTTYILTKF